MSTTTFDPAHPPQKMLSGSNKESFGYATLQSRLPVIVSKIVDDVYRAYNGLDADPSLDDSTKKQKEQEAKKIIETIGALRYELQRDKPFRPLTDSYPDVKEWNQALETFYSGSSWYKASWLFSECYLYRRIKEAFELSEHWKDYDPFFRQKSIVFKSSQKAVVAIAARLMSPVSAGSASGQDPLQDVNQLSSLDVLISQGPDSKGTQEAFYELAQICLWGNATDLSLLDNPDLAKVEELQRRMLMEKSSSSSSLGSGETLLGGSPDQQGAEGIANDEPTELEKHAEMILTNDLDKLWGKVKSLRNARVDIILDNAGFELYVDLVFADYLVRAGFASEVVFHAKRIPWFVSDVLPFDFDWTLRQLYTGNADGLEAFFDPEDPAEQKAIKDLGSRWRTYVSNGTWRVTSHDFWTSCYAFYHLPTLPTAADLFGDMQKSDLWIFKGDLNYRKLVYDCLWPTTTTFEEAIGPLGGKAPAGRKAAGVPSLVSFRTCKADVVVGLAPGVAEAMDIKAKDWMVSGEYAVISFS
ncbi:hypothetical protein BGW38_002198 [Lunasporangiospora selenospora]|uniref:Sugar phosphate phosphatase n=1 Tax=Lunasporangiospora selenospora TaxID=979761 RepID=A0A9P6KDL2_9FUNG|nr:hypothetical protein BGW38_002198 [Lunasporangiospora selenospora]